MTTFRTALLATAAAVFAASNLESTSAQSFGGSGGTNQVTSRSAPEQTWKCYLEWDLRDRFMRLPQSMDNLIGLIRKIEASPQGYSWDIEKMSSVILKRFRTDGIFFRPYDNRNPTSGPEGLYEGITQEEQKQQLLIKLAPDRNANEFPEDALTNEEKCGLHFMLSYSLNDTRRPDESNRGSSVIVGRRKREADPQEQLELGEGVFLDEEEDVDEGTQDAGDGEEANSAAKQSPPRGKSATGGESARARLSDGGISRAAKKMRDDAEEGLIGDSGLSAPLAPMALSQQGPLQQGSARQVSSYYEKSQYPLEYGVVYTRYGTVAAGAVLAGISFGLQDRSMRVEDILPDKDLSSWPTELFNAQIINYYAGTVAGDIAQSSIHNAVNLNDQLIGPGGKWNDTVLPTEYSLDVPREKISSLTNAELLGGIDGLILARKIKQWDQSYVKLSHILEMYYSHRGVNLGRASSGQPAEGVEAPKFRACDRFRLIKDESVVRRQELEDQARAFAYALHAASGRPIIGTSMAVEALKSQVDRVLKEFWKFVDNEGNGMQTEWDCLQSWQSTSGSSNNNLNNLKSTNIPYDTRIDLHVMIDSDSMEQDRYGAMYGISAAIAKMQMDHAGSNRIGVNMTMSDSWQCFLDVGEEPNKAMVAHKMLRAESWGYAGRFDIRVALDNIRKEYQEWTRREFMDNAGGTNAKVFVLVIPKNRPTGIDERELDNLFWDFYRQHPDIEVIFVTRSTEWKRWIPNDKNFINLNQFSLGDKIYDRLKEIPARLTFPRCRDGNAYENGNKYEGYFTPGTRQIAAYNPVYFFASNTMYIKIRFMQKLPIEVCARRHLDKEDGIKCGKVTDSSDNSVEFQVRPFCGRTCQPIYLTMVMDPTVDTSVYQPVCGDERLCAFPDQVKYEVTHAGMWCNSAFTNKAVTSVAALLPMLAWAIARILTGSASL